MLRGQLTTALDWRKRRGDKSGAYSYRTGDTWSVVQYGPGYSNTFLIMDYDDLGLRWLERHEKKEAPSARDRTV